MKEQSYSQYEERLDFYKRVLKKSPLHDSAIVQCEQNIADLSAEMKLRKRSFLHTFAPVLVNFVCFCIEKAIKEQRKTLYFLARDGYSMYLVAKKICEELGIPVQCKYLKVSRFSLRTAEYHLLGEKAIDYICIGGIDITFEKIMQRGALTLEEASHIAELAGYKERYNEILSYMEIQELKETLRKIPELLQYIEAHSKKAYPTAIGYLEQEGLLQGNGNDFAIVDSGWIGTLQLSLERVLQTKKPDMHVTGYYFGLYETPPNVHENTRYIGYYFNKTGDIGRKARFSNCLFEAVFSAPDGMALGYEIADTDAISQENAMDYAYATFDGQLQFAEQEQGAKEKTLCYVAVESDNKNPNAEMIVENNRWAMEYVSYYLNGFFAGMTSENDGEEQGTWKQFLEKSQVHSIRITNAIFGTLMSKPEPWEVSIFGNYLFCDDVRESQVQEVAATITTEEIRNQHFFNKLLIMAGIKHQKIRESAWIEGSIVRNGVRVSSNLWHALFYKYFVYIRKSIKNYGK